HLLRSARTLLPTLLPYTSLFRSAGVGVGIYHVVAQTISVIQFCGHVAQPSISGELFLSPDLQPLGRVAGVSVITDKILHGIFDRSEEHTSELQSRFDLVCRLLLE